MPNSENINSLGLAYVETVKYTMSINLTLIENVLNLTLMVPHDTIVTDSKSKQNNLNESNEILEHNLMQLLLESFEIICVINNIFFVY